MATENGTSTVNKGFVASIKELPINAWKCFTLCITYVGLGLFHASTGPALLDLQLLVDTTVEQITYIMPVRSFGAVIGCAIGRQKDRHFTLTTIFNNLLCCQFLLLLFNYLRKS